MRAFLLRGDHLREAQISRQVEHSQDEFVWGLCLCAPGGGKLERCLCGQEQALMPCA